MQRQRYPLGVGQPAGCHLTAVVLSVNASFDLEGRAFILSVWVNARPHLCLSSLLPHAEPPKFCWPRTVREEPTNWRPGVFLRDRSV